MEAIRSWAGAAAVLTAAILLQQGCTALVYGTSQKIPMTSSPSGARIIVDGKDRGTTPCTLKLSTRKSHIIRIECEGYNPYEIRVVRENQATFWGIMFNNLILGGLAAGLIVGFDEDETMEEELLTSAALIGSISGLAGLDYALGAPYSLRPETVDVRLSPADGRPRVDVIEMTADRLREARWIRITKPDGRQPCFRP